MKKILITGTNSYIGTSFENYIKENFSEEYEVSSLDMIGDGWRSKDFSGYDAVFHVAGIAHRKETAENADLYYKVNRDLVIETCKKAKEAGVGQFVFLSSMSVYGMDTGIITKETVPDPKTNYGKSKLQAEEGILPLADESFRVCVLRPPMVYGEGCKGNYQSIVKIVEKSPVFPRVKNRRSSIHVDNLASFVRMAIDKNLQGIYFPQNEKSQSTKELARDIAKSKNKKIYFSVLLGLAVIIFRPFITKLKKAFGTLVYEGTEDFDFEYCIRH